MKNNILWGTVKCNYFQFAKDLFIKFNSTSVQEKLMNFSSSNIRVFDPILIYKKLLIQSIVNMLCEIDSACSKLSGNFIDKKLLCFIKI